MSIVADGWLLHIASSISGKKKRKAVNKLMQHFRVELYEDCYPDEACAVREKVFIEEQGFSYDRDEKDDEAIHFVAFVKDEAVGACRIFRSDDREVFVFGRLAVKKEYRGLTVGSELLAKAVEYAKMADGNKVILHSQIQAKEFYLKNGFEAYGEIEPEEGCPHIWMALNIKTEQ